MLISATVDSRFQHHQVTLSTSGKSHTVAIPPRPSGLGSSANGGELLCLAMATCFCNDIYREAAKRGLEVTGVEVQATAEFGSEGTPAQRLAYRVTVRANAPEASIGELITHTDGVAEVQNTLRLGLPVTLESFSVVSTNAA
ncbi:MAG TPA: OsmC family protein [Burkholderiales bacterium]|nr:OsmC family protein [Burkholderiales bacterium]